MDPLSALIGGGASLIGGLMNTSSQQSINAANLQQQIWSATGGYLPGLVQNAEKAGLSPLAVLGSRGPNMAVQVGTQPGAGLQQAGNILSRMDIEGRETDLQLKREEIQRQAALTKQTNIDNATKQFTYEGLQSGKFVPAGMEPAAETTIPGAFIKGGQQVIDRSREFIKDLPSFHSWGNTFRQLGVPPIFDYGGRFYDYLGR